MSNFFHQTLTYFVQGWNYLTIHTMNIHINHLYHINSHIPSLICTQQRLTMSNYDAYSSFDITGQELERRITDCSLVGYMKRLLIGVGAMMM
jgi:hypothetical protein